MTDMKTDAMEMYPDGNELNIRSPCPDKEGMGCESDSDCTKEISAGKLSEQCSRQRLEKRRTTKKFKKEQE